MRHSRRAYGRKHNEYTDTTGAKDNRRRRSRKRNDASQAGGMGMYVLKTVGVVVLGAAAALGATLGLSLTSLSAGAQDGLLIGGGLVLGAAAMFFKRPALAVGLSTGPLAVGLVRAVVRMNVMDRAASVVSTIGAQTSVRTPAAAAANPAPAGWVTGTPGWSPMIGSGVHPDNIANMTTPMVGYALG